MALKILFQILIFVLFVIGNGYQSVITTFMVEPMKLSTFRTIDELFDSNYQIILNPGYAFVIANRESFTKADAEDRLFPSYEYKESHTTDSKKINLAVNFPCSDVDLIIKSNETINANFYKLPESYFKTYLELDVGLLNPFLSQMQHFMDLSFEMGLPTAWKTFHENFQRNIFFKNRSRSLIETKNTLDFSQILPICVVLLIGQIFALLVFLMEVFYHDCARNLNYYSEKYRKFKEGKLIKQKKLLLSQESKMRNC